MFLPLARLLYPPTAFGRTSGKAYCCSVQANKPRGLMEAHGVGTKRLKRESRRPSFDLYAVSVNPLMDVADRPIRPRECIACSLLLADGHELRRHLLSCHHLESTQPKQRGRPVVFSRNDLRYIEDAEELRRLYGQYYSARKRKMESAESSFHRGNASPPLSGIVSAEPHHRH